MTTEGLKKQVTLFALHVQNKKKIDSVILIAAGSDKMEAYVEGHVEPMAWALATACVDNKSLEEMVRKAYRRINLIKKQHLCQTEE